MVEDQIAEVFVESKQQALFGLSAGENGGIRNAGGSFPNPQDIVTSLAECDYTRFRQIFVGAKKHGSGGARENLLFADTLLGVGNARA